jgi:4-amino-4-deoxy-L-arabinose transferase
MHNHWKFILLLFISAIVLFLTVGSYGLLESSDARYAEIARAMYISGDYLHPNLMDVHHYHKPPLTYQITALGYHLFGVNTFGARFFLQIAILIQMILVYALTLQLFNKRETALWAAMIYLTFPLLLIASRNLTTDAFLAMFALLSIYAWVRYRKEGKMRYLYLFTLSLALGFLAKGPVIFIVPLIFIIFYNRTEPSKNSFGYHHLFAWLLFAALASYWFIYLLMQNPQFLDYFLGRQTVDRFSKDAFSRTEPFWYFLVFAPIVGLPWLFILPYMIKVKKALFTKRSLYMALLLAVLIPVIFFSFSSSKRVLYILPFYGLLAVLIAQLLSTLDEGQSRIVNRIVLGYAMIVLLFSAATLLFETTFIIPGVLGIMGLLLILPVLWIYRNKKMTFKSRAVTVSFVVSAFLLGGSGMVIAANQLKLGSMKPVTDFIIAKGLQDRNIIMYNLRKPSIAFHLNKSIISLNETNPSLARETEFEQDLNWKKYLIDMNKDEEQGYLKELLATPSVFIVYLYPKYAQYPPLAPQRLWIKNGFPHKEKIGNWIVYY